MLDLGLFLFKYIAARTAANLEPVWAFTHSFVIVEVHARYCFIDETYFQLIISFQTSLGSRIRDEFRHFICISEA